MFLRNLAIVALATSGFAVLMSSCKRDKNNEPIVNEGQTGYAEEQLALEQIYTNADRVVERAFVLGEGSLKGGENPLGGCVTIKKDTTDNPDLHLMTIDFGGAGCLGFDGRVRTGQLHVYYAHKVKLTEAGYYRKTVFSSYTVDKYRVNGSRQMWYAGTKSTGNHHFAIVSVDTIYLPDNSGRVTGASERTREWFRGASTPQTADDAYRITGFGNFIRPNGDKYYLEIAKPLVDALDCNWINEGVTNIFPENATQRVLDYGEGDCENDATINVNGAKRLAKIP
ncbi:MAG TPA: hypothetical protein VIN07_08340 [Flavipsychrobacter sp.]